MVTRLYMLSRYGYLVHFTKWALLRENLSSGFPSKQVSNQYPQLQRQSRKFKISPVACLHMKYPIKRITKVLIRLRGCAGWSTPVLFANHRRQVFSQRGPNKINSHLSDCSHSVYFDEMRPNMTHRQDFFSKSILNGLPVIHMYMCLIVRKPEFGGSDRVRFKQD